MSQSWEQFIGLLWKTPIDGFDDPTQANSIVEEGSVRTSNAQCIVGSKRANDTTNGGTHEQVIITATRDPKGFPSTTPTTSEKLSVMWGKSC